MGYTICFRPSRHPTSELGHTPLQWDILTIHNLPSWYVGRLDAVGGVRIVRTFWRLWRLDSCFFWGNLLSLGESRLGGGPSLGEIHRKTCLYNRFSWGRSIFGGALRDFLLLRLSNTSSMIFRESWCSFAKNHLMASS